MIVAGHIETHVNLRKRRNDLAQIVLDMHLGTKPKSDSRFRVDAIESCTGNIKRIISYLEEALLAESPQLFSDYVAWTDSMLTSRNKSTQPLYDSLKYLDEACKWLLHSADSSILSSYINESVKSAKNRPQTVSYFESDNCVSPDARKFLELLLKGERRQALLFTHELLQNGMSIPDIYENIFQVSQYEVGRLWEINQITIAQEHFCTASTQFIMASLYENIFTGKEKKGVILGCSIDDDLHELGIRMLTDLFEMDGWDTYYMGANMPADSIVAAIKERSAGIVAISVTMPLQIGKVISLIRSIRQEENLRRVKIIVGGAAFNKVPGLWSRIGADATAANSRDAIQWANKQLV